jgi:hypothetical protein
MNIDWSKAPEGATHYCEDWHCTRTDGVQYYRCNGSKWEFWTENAKPNHWVKCSFPCRPVAEIKRSIDARVKAFDDMVKAVLGKLGSSVSECSVRDICAAALDLGYRKFEIVEEDV